MIKKCCIIMVSLLHLLVTTAPGLGQGLPGSVQEPPIGPPGTEPQRPKPSEREGTDREKPTQRPKKSPSFVPLLKKSPKKLVPIFLEVKESGKDSAKWGKARTFSSNSELFELRWWTPKKGVEAVQWQISNQPFTPGEPLSIPKAVLASGISKAVAPQPNRLVFFTVKGKQFAPDLPPGSPKRYYVRVVPLDADLQPVGTASFQVTLTYMPSAEKPVTLSPVLGGLVLSEPLTEEEEKFVSSFTNEINHAIVMVAANPDVSFPEGSLGARLQKVFARLGVHERLDVQKRARALLSGDKARLRHLLGEYSEVGLNAPHLQTTRGISTGMQEMLKKAVHARLDAQREEILFSFNTGKQKVANFELPKTWVEAGFFTQEGLGKAVRQMTINEPMWIDFRWKTEEAEAEEGLWKLTRVVGDTQQLLATGVAGDAPGGIFSIDFGDYISPEPPEQGAVYHVRVLPRKKKTAVNLGSQSVGADATGKGGYKLAAKAVGPWSLPVIITYEKNESPPQKFEFHDLYRKAKFRLGSIHMVEDQWGPGAEEFHIAGFVQENFPISAGKTGKRVKFKHYAELDPDGPRDENLGSTHTFHLNNPDQPEWPRSYTTVITIMEEDGGDDLAEWESDIWQISNDMLHGQIADMVGDYLEEYKDELIKQGIHMGAEAVQLIANLATSTAGAIVGMVGAAAAMIISSIILDMEDDFYGVEAATLVLPTNDTEFVDSLGSSLSEKIKFCGAPSAISAGEYRGCRGVYDGVVEVGIRWEFSEKEPY